MTDFGVSADGFVPKGFDTILSDAMQRARDLFGDDLDLSPTSPVRKILEVTASEDADLWRHLEDLHYSRFISAAVGTDLDLLGEDLAVPRRFGYAGGTVTITLNSPQPDRSYLLPEGTVLVAAGVAPVTFHTIAPVILTGAAASATVAVEAFESGPQGDVDASSSIAVDPVYQQLYLSIVPPTTLTVANTEPFAGGSDRESDESYRSRLLGWPRSMWTLESVRAAVLDVPGVRDVLLSDPLGGVDVSQSYFGIFAFGRRPFSAERRVGDPYFFDVVVAHDFVRPWQTTGSVVGVFEQVTAALDRVRPVGIHPRVIEADHVEVGVRAQVFTQPGYDTQALVGAITQQLADTSGLKLGGAVLYSQVMRALVNQPGVVDVQNLRLRRCPPAFGRIAFGGVRFQSEVVEAGAGENLAMGPTEIAVFRADSALLDLQVTAR